MKQRLFWGTIRVVILILYLTTSSCQERGRTPGSDETQYVLVGTQTVSPLLIPSIVPTETEQAPTSGLTATLTKQPSPTPDPAVPTLSPTEVKLLVDDLLINNRGCELPCWWGIVPGETKWRDAEHFLVSFSLLGQGETGMIVQNGESVILTSFTSYYPIDSEDGTGYAIYSINNDVIQAIHMKETGYGSAFSLQQMFLNYGKPKEIKLSAHSVSLSDYLPFRLLLAYPEQGILALFDYKGKLEQEQIRACPGNLGPELWLYSPTEPPDLINRIEPLGPDPVNPLQPIELVSDWTVDTFYTEFKQDIVGLCFDTPVQEWK